MTMSSPSVGSRNPSAQSRGSQPGLQAPELTAGALGSAVRSDDDMTDLTGRESASEQQAAVQQKPGTDTVTDLDQHHVGARPTEAVFGQYRGARVVPHDHRDPEAGGEGVLEVLIAPTQVRGAEHDTGRVDDSGRSDPDAEDGHRGPGDKSLGECDHLGRRIRAGAAGQRRLHPFEDLAVEVEHRSTEDRVLTEVEADDLQAAPIDIEQSGWLARPGG